MASMEGWTYGRTINDVITKTKISRIDGLPYFSNHGAPCARARSSASKHMSSCHGGDDQVKEMEQDLAKPKSGLPWLLILTACVVSEHKKRFRIVRVFVFPVAA